MTVMDPGDDFPSAGPSGTDPVLSTPGHPADSVAAAAEVPSLTDEQAEAFSVFYRAQIIKVAAFLRFQGASWPEAADASQEAMTRAYQRWNTLNNPAAWVRKVATREFIRRRVRSSDDLVEDVPEPVTSLLRDDVPEASAGYQEEEKQVQRLLALLPPRQRQVMAWTYDGYTPSEIAEQLSTPEHPVTSEAVRASLKLARRALAQHLGPGKDQP
jgi:RNA polymerase sigma factor (sigma-70 family)